MEKHPMNESIAVYENNTPANEERVPKNTQELIQEEFNFAPTGEESNALEVYAEDFQANQERVKIEQAWLNAKNGNLAMLESEGRAWESSTHVHEEKIQIPAGFSFDESTDCLIDNCACTRNHA
tara:strand:+ start:360 stop:731 length:372 start_codon:yes stop_codon:yes gene_type:complete